MSNDQYVDCSFALRSTVSTAHLERGGWRIERRGAEGRKRRSDASSSLALGERGRESESLLPSLVGHRISRQSFLKKPLTACALPPSPVRHVFVLPARFPSTHSSGRKDVIEVDVADSCGLYRVGQKPFFQVPTITLEMFCRPPKKTRFRAILYFRKLLKILFAPLCSLYYSHCPHLFCNVVGQKYECQVQRHQPAKLLSK